MALVAEKFTKRRAALALVRRGTRQCSIAAVIISAWAFTRPWVQIQLDLSFVARTGAALGQFFGGKTSGEKRAIASFKTLSGIEIPRAANEKFGRQVGKLTETLTGKRQHIGLKSYGVCLVPGAVIALAGVLIAFPFRPVVPLIVVCTGVLLSSVGMWRLGALEAAEPTIDIRYGLWLSLAAYLLPAAAGAILLLPDRARRKAAMRQARAAAGLGACVRASLGRARGFMRRFGDRYRPA